MDEPLTTLIADHGYCSQELVNLLVLGVASSNVFDHELMLDDDKVIKGIPYQSDIGFLSRLEVMKHMTVGDNYKQPKFPIYIIYNESHYSTMFSKVMLDKPTNTFEIFYYDSLGYQDHEIKITVQQAAKNAKPDAMFIPLNEIIRTVWSNAQIDWNGYEPIL